MNFDKVPCETCRTPLLAMNGRWNGCDPCETAASRFRLRSGQEADADYAYHELAHFVVLFGRLPASKDDWALIEVVIEQYPVGRGQLHELRTIALQYVSQEYLGWQPSLDRLVGMSWSGIRDFGADAWPEPKGRSIVKTEAQAISRVRGFIPRVSKRRARMYTRAVLELRGQA